MFALVVFFVLTLCPCHILIAFIIFGNSSSIIFAVVRSTFVAFALSFAFFELSSLACVNTLYFDDFFHTRRQFMHHVLLLCAVLSLLLHFHVHSLSFHH